MKRCSRRGQLHEPALHQGEITGGEMVNLPHPCTLRKKTLAIGLLDW